MTHLLHIQFLVIKSLVIELLANLLHKDIIWAYLSSHGFGIFDLILML